MFVSTDAHVVTLVLRVTVEHGDELLASDLAGRVLAVGHAVRSRPLLGLGVPAVAALGVYAVEAGEHRPDHRAGQGAPLRLEAVRSSAVHEHVPWVDVLQQPRNTRRSRPPNWKS